MYLLDQALVFPPPEHATEDGLVAIGGDARPERLVLAYSQGIFPWPARGYPLLWFSPDPRFLLDPREACISRSLRKAIARGRFEIRADTRFRDVIRRCAEKARPGQRGTWITDELLVGYVALHDKGYAHSVEAFLDGELVGGLYGVSLGSCFCGESMFADVDDASKVAFVTLLGQALAWGFDFVDCQVRTDHLARFGAVDVPRSDFLERLRESVTRPTRVGRWKLEVDPAEALRRLDRARLDRTAS